ncbi:MAG: hypothetical protein SPJ97_04505 [Bacteroides sp.]|nr:hypothetical protein [Bacteroides sp.]
MKPTIRRRRSVVAWILLVSLLPLFVVKATHFHDEHGACTAGFHHHEGHGHHHHSDESKQTGNHHCDICLFSLSSFTETAILEFYPLECPILPVGFCYRASRVTAQTVTPSLRAPPCRV